MQSETPMDVPRVESGLHSSQSNRPDTPNPASQDHPPGSQVKQGNPDQAPPKPPRERPTQLDLPSSEPVVLIVLREGNGRPDDAPENKGTKRRGSF